MIRTPFRDFGSRGCNVVFVAVAIFLSARVSPLVPLLRVAHSSLCIFALCPSRCRRQLRQSLMSGVACTFSCVGSEKNLPPANCQSHVNRQTISERNSELCQHGYHSVHGISTDIVVN